VSEYTYAGWTQPMAHTVTEAAHNRLDIDLPPKGIAVPDGKGGTTELLSALNQSRPSMFSAHTLNRRGHTLRNRVDTFRLGAG